MRQRAWLTAGLLAVACSASALAQTSPASAAASATAPAPSVSAPSASSRSPRAASPIQTQFKAFKVHFGKEGKEELEPALSASPGDVVEYVALHRNVSERRLLNVDFAIPIPWGTTLWEGSVQPPHGKLVAAEGKGAKSKDRARVVWRVERLDPGQSVEIKLRVGIDPDPTLAPKSVNPWAPPKPELRR